MAKKINFKKIKPGDTGKFKSEEDVEVKTKELLDELYELLYVMFADSRYSLLITLHGIDSSGKDGTVKHIFKGANPQGIKTFSFKKPSEEELKHDFIWRCHKHAPEAGQAAIFNRSYYEEVSAVQVHPEILEEQHLPEAFLKDKKIFEKRYHHINHFEKMLHDNGTLVLKFLLHISEDEQKARFKERLEAPRKNWKFSEQDLKERKKWDKYMQVFENMIAGTNSKHSPWFVIPSNKKWYRNYLVTKILVDELSKLPIKFPKLKTTKVDKEIKKLK